MLTKNLFFLSLSLSLSLNLFAQGKVGINTTTPSAMLHVKDSSIVFTGNNPLPVSPGLPPISGIGTRMMWYPGKAAFRAGMVDGLHWSRDSVGIHSIAVGHNNVAKGSGSISMGTRSRAMGGNSIALGYGNVALGFGATAIGTDCDALTSSVAIGTNNIASGSYSTAIGVDNIASGTFSTALGGQNRAIGYSSTAMGYHTRTKSYATLGIGQYNDTTSLSSNTWNLLDPVFIIGNGTAENDRRNAMTVLKNGNTGVGSMSPKTLLHVSRSNTSSIPSPSAVAVFEDDTDVSVNLIAPAADGSAIFFGNPSSVQDGGIIYNVTPANGLSFRTNGNATRAVIDDVGNFGIGDVSPNSKLHVSKGFSGATYNGTAGVIIEDDASSYLQFANPSGSEAGLLSATDLINIRGGFIFRPDSSVQIRSGGNTTRISILANGNTGIGTTAPSEKLHVVGDICYTGSIAACSDIRYKKNFRPITNALASLDQLQGMYYDWNTEAYPDKEFNSDRQIGFSAQELEKIYPEVVQTDPDGFKSVDYSRLTPILVEAVKEQQTMIEEQNKKIEIQQDQIGLILQELVALKNQLAASAIKE